MKDLYELESNAKLRSFLETTPGEIEFFVRLNPTIVDEGMSSWRKCSSQEYFAVKGKRKFGGLVETRIIARNVGLEITQEI